MMSLHRATLLIVVLALAGCSGPAPESGPKSYDLAGQVIAVSPETRTLTVAHEDIPDFMPAMTMDFVVLEKDAVLLDKVSPGDEITARLVVPDSRYWLEDLVVVKKGTGSPPSDHRAVRVLQPGDALPDVALVNQDGDVVRLSDYRGRSLAITFIFTRCPFPEFCPRMMAHFASAHGTLLADESRRDATHLLSVSFDTSYDTPEVLHAYGAPYQKTTPPFSHWELVTGSAEDIRTLGESLGLTYVEESGDFAHNLRTAVVDPEGHLAHLFTGNEWTAEELVARMEDAAS